MQTLVGIDGVGAAAGPLAVALGNFDGLHLGHRAVIEAARERSRQTGARLCVATFDPAPRRFFNPQEPPFRILTDRQRAAILRDLGVDVLLLLPFDARMAAMSDRTFVTEALCGIGAVSVAAGFDFHFGRGRMGDGPALKRLGAEAGIVVDIVEKISADGEKVSSSRIRQAIADGDMAGATRLLGRPWVIDGVVEHGEKRGRTLGFPTANIRLGDIIEPRFGVYAVHVKIDGESAWRRAAASYGRTPTTGVREPLLELFLLDFEGDLYGRRLDVAFRRFLRPELRFGSLDALVVQMKKDVDEVIALLERG